MHAEIYTKPNCPYCVKAKAIFEKRGFTYIEVSAVDQREPLIERVMAETGTTPKSVPQIWLDDQYVGGHDDLVKLLAALDAADVDE